MSSSDRSLLPACTCGQELSLTAPFPLPNQDVTYVRIYRCNDCGHETRIIVWGAEMSQGAGQM
jgi:hypothetical protein